MRVFGTAAAVLTVMAIVTADGTAAPAPAKGGCDQIRLSVEPLVFYKHNLHCAKAKRLARKVHNSGGSAEPRHYYCDSSTDFTDQGNCHHNRKDKYFGWHVYTKRR
jgi:hypothetical protein